MASLRPNLKRKGGSTYHQVRYRLDGKETSDSFDDYAEAVEFRDMVNNPNVGAARAREIWRRRLGAASAMTVEQWLTHHIDHLTGVERRTLEDYRRYLKNDIGPAFGAIPLEALTGEDVALWVHDMWDDGEGFSSKTIANKHGFLSGALNDAVDKGKLAANPAAGQRLPVGERDEMVFLTRDQFDILLAEIPAHWKPLVRFLVASGCRLGEATALRPADVDRRRNKVRIARAWKGKTVGRWDVGPTKSRRERTVTVPASVLADLDYTGEWLFTTPGQGGRWKAGAPVRPSNFRHNVWTPAVERSKLDPPPRIHDLRHTCASWMLLGGVPPHVVQRHLGHKSIETTVGTYGHFADEHADAAAAAIDKALGD
jgi:integrase